MRKKYLIVGLVGIIILLTTFIIIRSVGKKVAANNLCKNFIVGIENGNSDATWQQLSMRAQQESSTANWGVQVKNLRGAYGDTLPTFKSRTQRQDGDSQYTQEIYVINNGSGPYTATCTTVNTPNGDRVDGFTSKLGSN